MADLTARCNNCRFFVKAVDREWAECRALPPSIGTTRWARVKADEWCGAWQESTPWAGQHDAPVEVRSAQYRKVVENLNPRRRSG